MISVGVLVVKSDIFIWLLTSQHKHVYPQALHERSEGYGLEALVQVRGHHINLGPGEIAKASGRCN